MKKQKTSEVWGTVPVLRREPLNIPRLVDELITSRMIEIAKEKIKDRNSGFDELKNIRDKINEEICRT